MFIDEAIFKVSAGDGGRGCVAFRREKFVPRGGPCGGDGGHGGSVIAVADVRLTTLLDLHRRRQIRASGGAHGLGKQMTGKDGEDVILRVPAGTLVYDEETSQLLGDLTEHEARLVLAKGGKGGKGNQHFATATRQAPDFAQTGLPGESLTVRLELRLLADVGIVGLPSVGKSTFISRISNAKPKIAEYPFTTLVPNLGLVRWRDFKSFVVADLPGLIEGAHSGRGLGHQFLRHLTRVRVIAHFIEVVDEDAVELGVERDPIRDYQTIRHELEQFDQGFSSVPEIVVLNKTDLPTCRSAIDSLAEYFAERQLPFVAISAVTGQGVQELVDLMGNTLDKMAD